MGTRSRPGSTPRTRRAGFLPTGGRVLALREPAGPGVRVDSGVRAGELVGSSYDPMLGKVIAHGADREEALRRLDAALADTVLLGVDTNLAFLRALLADPDVRAGRLDTGLVERRSDDWARPELPPEVPTAAALHALLALEPSGRSSTRSSCPAAGGSANRPGPAGGCSPTGHDPVPVRTRGRAARAQVAVGDAAPVDASAATRRRRPGRVAGRQRAAIRPGPGRRAGLARPPRAGVGAARAAAAGGRWSARRPQAGGPVRSPMPGTVTVVEVTEGQRVSAGDRLLVVEAMKMEHVLTAPVDGTVRELRARRRARPSTRRRRARRSIEED